MRRQKQNGISCWVLGFLAMLLCYAGPVSSEEDSANFVNARFLYQSTFGPTPALIDQVEEVGIESWIKQQLLLPATYHRPLYDTPFSKGAQANRENAWYQIVL
ncbi:DUF1800 domain-containing protein, partial [Escherichia coli]|nr:DUF1800 domain-containing protein [Escherichia coli]